MSDESNVPLGAKVVFCLQHSFFIVMAVVFVALLPIWWAWSKLHVSGQVFLSGTLEAMKTRHAQMKEHRKRVISLYRDRA